jgi:N-acylneuraminate cytidylyltransferase
MFRVGPQGRLQPLLDDGPAIGRRQDLPEVYVLNGAIYVADCAWLRQTRSFLGVETVGYVMPATRSIDIDEERDFSVLEKLAAMR